RIAEALRAAGVEAWLDQSELRGGDAWDASIRAKIRDCALFVPIISAHSDARSEGYFRLEWKLAVDRSHLMAEDRPFLLPVVVDDTSEAKARVPDRFRERQWTRVSDEHSIAAFVARVQATLEGDQRVAKASTPGPGRTDPPRFFSRRVLAAGAVALIALVGAYTAWRYVELADKPIESIAVLPFVNASGNEENEYLSDGMTETLIGSLSQLPTLAVKARSTVFNYKGRATAPQAVGRELKVASVLTGRLAQHGQDMSLYVELIDVAHDKVLWSEQYQRKQADLVALQGDIARDVATKLRAKLSRVDAQKLATMQTANPDAYRAYLKGNFYTNKLTRDGFAKGVEYYREAIALDPNYALAYSGLAYNYINAVDWFIPPKEAAPKAREAAAKALAIDPASADAHLVLAIVAFWYDWNWAESDREFRRAIELDPKDPLPYPLYSWLLAVMGRHDEALAMAKRGQELDPVSALMPMMIGSVLLMARQPDLALEQFKVATDLDPTFWYTAYFAGHAWLIKGMPEKALVQYKHALELEADNSENWANVGYTEAVLGRKDEARKVLAELHKRAADRYVAPYNIAIVHAGLGERDEAFRWLERAYSERSSLLSFLPGWDPRLASLRGDPRLDDLIRRVGLPR
ncbi:MAG: TIR domain-containing protein, partial [Bacillota bacterium]